MLPPGSTVSSGTQHNTSTSHTGAIVGGAVGGGVGLIFLVALLAICFRRQRARQRSLDAFDGNFDPDRIVAGEKSNVKGEPKVFNGRGPTLPDIAAGRGDDDLDDGMGGRLAGSSVGGGVVAPYPLYHPTTAPSSRSHSSSGAPLMSNHSYSAPSQPSQPPYATSSNERLDLPNPFSAGPGSTSSGGTRSAQTAQSGPSGAGRFNVSNPDDSAGFVGGFNAPRVGRGEKTPGGPSSSARDVLVHQDGGKIEEEEGPDEIPPTYDSLVPGSAPRVQGGKR